MADGEKLELLGFHIEDFRVDIYRGGGTAVRVTHMPTGTVATREGPERSSSRIMRDECIVEIIDKLDQGIPTAQQEADLFELHRPEREAIAEGERRRGR